MLLGLELLVAGDIIRTAAVDPTFGSAGYSASSSRSGPSSGFSLEVELEGAGLVREAGGQRHQRPERRKATAGWEGHVTCRP